MTDFDLELRYLPLLLVELVTKLEERVILLREPCLELIDACVFIGHWLAHFAISLLVTVLCHDPRMRRRWR